MLNTGFGLGGLVDLASDARHRARQPGLRADVRQVGIPTQGPYLFVPLFGPTTVRDGAGVDRPASTSARLGYITDVPRAQYDLCASAPSTFARSALEATRLVDTAALDRYLFIRNAYLQRRRYLRLRRQAAARTRGKQ